MPREQEESINNKLLLSLPKSRLERMRPLLRPVTLKQGQPIDTIDNPVRYHYFVNRGFVSMVKTMHDGRSVEIGGIGVEGLTAPSALLGFNVAVMDTVVQIPGTAFRIERDLLKREVEHDAALGRMILDYTRFLLGDIAQTAACNRLHSIEERCCRWLLVAHDNALSERFILTQEFLATMLGTQRAGVSLAARALKNANLIKYTRGQVEILDRHGLEEEACECYRSHREALENLYSR